MATHKNSAKGDDSGGWYVCTIVHLYSLDCYSSTFVLKYIYLLIEHMKALKYISKSYSIFVLIGIKLEICQIISFSYSKYLYS